MNHEQKIMVEEWKNGRAEKGNCFVEVGSTRTVYLTVSYYFELGSLVISRLTSPVPRYGLRLNTGVAASSSSSYSYSYYHYF